MVYPGDFSATGDGPILSLTYITNLHLTDVEIPYENFDGVS